MNRPVDIAPGVAWFPALTPTLPPATHTNSYALGDGPCVLVEPATPFEDEQAAWLRWAHDVAKTHAIEAIVVTHHHPDHVGGASRFAQALGLPVWAHAETASRIEVPVARTLAEGDELRLGSQIWRVMFTPGHAPGHVCLVEPSLRIAIVGDMVASAGTILIDPIDGHLGHYLAELRRLEGLVLDVALPAHGAPITEPRNLFRHYVDHRLKREAKVVHSIERAGTATLDALLPLAYDDTITALWPLARLSLESHLLELERQGRAALYAGSWSLTA